MKVIKGFLTLLWTGVSLLLIYLFWNGTIPERISGTESPSGIKPRFEMTGTRGWAVKNYKTTLFLTPEEGERFVYSLGEMGTRDAVHRVMATVQWREEGNLFSFTNQVKGKAVSVLYTNGFWHLTENAFPTPAE